MKRQYIHDLQNVIKSPEDGYKALGLMILRQVSADLQLLKKKGWNKCSGECRRNYLSAKHFSKTDFFASLVEYFDLEKELLKNA